MRGGEGMRGEEGLRGEGRGGDGEGEGEGAGLREGVERPDQACGRCGLIRRGKQCKDVGMERRDLDL